MFTRAQFLSGKKIVVNYLHYKDLVKVYTVLGNLSIL